MLGTARGIRASEDYEAEQRRQVTVLTLGYGALGVGGETPAGISLMNRDMDELDTAPE